jgi:hypothetical protein
MSDDLVRRIACVCHEANRGYQKSFPAEGIPIAKPWSEFREVYPDQAKGVEEGVRRALDGASPVDLHRNWCRDKINDGWTYGPEKNVVAKTHPCLLPHDELPEEQRTKDYLFAAIVSALKPSP